ncbi:MAG: electron transport complex subunit E [Bacteroidales bacterium]|nr:electron transport complex subunit E [Bacteroidales bacterium]
MKGMKIVLNGLIKENPTFCLLLGMCPTLATTTSAINGMGMGLCTMFVLMCSNMAVSAIKNLIPDKVRIPAFVVVIATFVTILQLCLQAYVPALNKSLGIFIPLIVVNCIILGRAEAFASKHNVVDSLLDGIGIGLGFTLALTLLGSVREMLGAGSIFGYKFIAPDSDGILLFILPPGAFIALGYLIALVNQIRAKKK